MLIFLKLVAAVFWIRRLAHSHQSLLSDHLLLYVFRRVQSLTVFDVARWNINVSISAQLIWKLWPSSFRVTIVVGKGTPFVVGCQLRVFGHEKFLESDILEFAWIDLVNDFAFERQAVLGDAFCQLIYDHSVSHTLWYPNLDYLLLEINDLLLAVSLLDALNCAANQVLILRYGLLLKPNVELAFNELHFEFRVTWDSFIITKHPFGF